MNPVFGVALSAILLHESSQIPFWQGGAALVCITIGIVISQRGGAEVS